MFIFLLILSLLIIIGTIAFSANLFSENITIAILLIISMIPFVGILLVFIRKHYRELKAGIPFDDERTKKVRMYAAGYAYFVSLYVWIILLMFHKYLDRDDILIIGLLGMFISFNLSWVLINRKKDIG